MTVVRRLARPMLAAIFIKTGIDQVRNARDLAPSAEPVAHAVAGPLHLPDDPVLLVRINGAAMAGAGVLFALGRLPRVTSAVLATTLAPSAYVNHPFWTEKDKTVRGEVLEDFLKDVGLLGGALLAAVDTAGKPGLAWRGRRAGRDARRFAKLATREAAHVAGSSKKDLQLAAAKVG
ncbi:DoxX family membrane protein [Kineococcus sp. R8]|uniref:DoxX family protein n=1 Tax=Kineococcus siccus TaxID=2696567 RepID=UPI0014134F9A|nr:DoxX family protein [Kineococcus siccus]NAZ81253.1 DoxX family membrane protein [Kineococcus siccus]